MNKIIKKCVLYLRQMHLTSPNILRHQHQIKYKNAFSTGRFPLQYFSSSLTTIRYFSNINQTGVLNLSGTNDFILTSIKTANETKNILEMLRLHNSVMTAQQYMQALNSIFLLHKNNRSNMKNEELARSPEFTALCHKIQNYSRNLELNDILNCVKCLSYLGVSVNSNIMQILLQLISKMINDMSLQQITFLHFLLKELSPCPLVDALNIALPIVFETQVQYQMDDNIYYQVEFLNYVTNRKLSQKTFDFIMSKIIKNIDQLLINSKMLKIVLLCLYHKDYSTDKYIDVINTCLQQYMSRIESIENDISYIEAILSRMLYKHFEESDIFYNEQYMNAIADYLIKKQESFEKVSYIIKKFNNIGYVNCDLIDYATSLLTSNNEILESSKFGVLLAYLASCANASYIPPGFIELKPHILKRLTIQKDVLELPWLAMTFNLAVLECWSEELLEKVFSKGFLHGFLKRSYNNIRDHLMLLKLYQATMTLYPGGYKGLLPPMEIIDKAITISLQKNDDYPLKAALEYGLGGDEYLLTGVNSKLGHSIDHLVIMRPGGYSVAIKNKMKCDNSKLFLENIIDKFSPNDNLVIGILFFKPSSYVINLNTLRGPHVLTNKSLEALGIVLLPLSMDVWDGLLDYEKIPYIMRELKSITDTHLIKETNVFH